MNRLGTWKLILMAREGDRKAIKALFESTCRAAYLLALTITKDKETARGILIDSYTEIFQNLDSLGESSGFLDTLCGQAVRQAEKALPSAPRYKFDASAEKQRELWNPDPGAITEFETLPGLDLSGAADNVLDIFEMLELSSRLSAYLFYFAEIEPAAIASLLGASEACIRGTLFGVGQTVIPQIGQIQKTIPALRGASAESVILWALQNTKKHAMRGDVIEDCFGQMVSGLVAAGALEPEIAAGPSEPYLDLGVDIPLQDMGVPNKSDGYSLQRFLKVFFIVMIVAVLFGAAFGLKRIRDYNMQRAEINRSQSRTTLPYSEIEFPTSGLVFSTEYSKTQPTEQSPVSTATGSASLSSTAEIPTETTTRDILQGLEYSVSGNSVTITRYSDSRASVEIPQTINGLTVTAIGVNAFYNSTVQSVKIPPTVNSIGASAFYNCTSLSSIIIPPGVTKIPENAFRGCSSLTTVSIPNTVTFIGAQAFYKCFSLRDIAVPSSVTHLGDWAFANCTSLTSITIPGAVMYVGKSLFYECTALTSCSLSVAPQTTALGEWMFFGCVSLRSFAVPHSVTAIPPNCFYGCRGLQTVSFPFGLHTIGDSAFFDCSSLAGVSFGPNLRRIGSSAFSGCTSIKRIDLPAGATTLGAQAFAGCTGLEHAMLPASVNDIGTGTFAGCSALTITCAAGSYAETYAERNGIKHTAA
ncbi:MAG: leucine-rich repeat domain-containing protein [Oscillospiraceae bacterium]|nr:leucine-rich repeat domain-containing protein [Oscillospiraceae bacterium]